MSKILVTPKDNVDGDALEDIMNEDGTFKLIDPEIWGYLVKIHTLQVSQITQEGLMTGVQMKAEVYWNYNRSLATVLCDVSDLVWLTFEDEYEEDEDDDSNEDQVDVTDSGFETTGEVNS